MKKLNCVNVCFNTKTTYINELKIIKQIQTKNLLVINQKQKRTKKNIEGGKNERLTSKRVSQQNMNDNRKGGKFIAKSSILF